MIVRAVIFDLGNTLVSYYRSHEFEPVLEECVYGLCAVLAPHGLELDSYQIYQKALVRRVLYIT